MSTAIQQEIPEDYLWNIFLSHMRDELRSALEKAVEPLIEEAAGAALESLKGTLTQRFDQYRGDMTLHVQLEYAKSKERRA